MSISIDTEKTFGKMAISLHDEKEKALKILGMERTCFNINKCMANRGTVRLNRKFSQR